MGVALPFPATECMYITTVNCVFSELDCVACVALEEKAVNWSTGVN